MTPEFLYLSQFFEITKLRLLRSALSKDRFTPLYLSRQLTH
jgi:hypothetical protein